MLKIGYSYAGPTEIGGLIVSPEYRKKPERLGLLISYVRFLYIAMHRDWFRDELLAELLPPLEPDGTSHLWNALGRKFTDMTYAEADRLSKKNKEFVKGLFPEGPIYATLLPEDAQSVIGKVGAQTRGRREDAAPRGLSLRLARRPVRRRPALHRADRRGHARARLARGARHQAARARRARSRRARSSPSSGPSRRSSRPERRRWRREPAADSEGAAIGPEAAESLGIHDGDSVWVLPLD